VSHLVLVETLWVLASVYGVRRREIASAVDLLLQHRALTLQDASVVAAALERFRQRSGTSFSDCLILEVALAAGHSPLGTFDAALGKATGAQRL
jgi:predicted nucleic-acid-binding protein